MTMYLTNLLKMKSQTILLLVLPPAKKPWIDQDKFPIRLVPSPVVVVVVVELSLTQVTPVAIQTFWSLTRS